MRPPTWPRANEERVYATTECWRRKEKEGVREKEKEKGV